MEYALETLSLTKQYGTKSVVDELNIHVPEGHIYGLLGRNGAGKTTTMRMVLGLIKPTQGSIRLFGQDYQKNKNQIYRKIGSIIETPGFYENLTGYENLKIMARLRGSHRRDSVENALKIVGLDKETDKIFADYSLGMKQRLGIAAAVMHEPELLILDEPINGLDPIGIYEIRNYLLKLCREKGTTVFISSHVLSEVEQLADIIGVMHEGRLIEEVDMKELHKRNRQYVEFKLSDVNATSLILERDFGLDDYIVCNDNTIRLFEGLDKRGLINKKLVEQGITVLEITVSEEKLEDYFSGLIGGGSIA